MFNRAHAIFFNDVGNRVDLGGLANGLVGSEATLRIDEVRCEDSVDQRGLAESCLADADDIELKTALQQLLLDLGGDAVEADVALGEDRRLLLRVHRRHCRC